MDICLIIGAKKMWHRLVIAVAEICCIVALVGSRSSSGFIALAIGAVILALVLLSRKKKLFAAGIVVVVIGVIAAGVLANTTGIGQTLKKTVVGTYHMKDQFSLNDIKTNTDDVELDIWNNPLYVSYDLGSDTLILKAGRTASAFYSKVLLFADSLKAQPDGQQEFRRLMLLYAKEGRISELTSNTSEYIYQNWPDGCITTRAKLGKEPVEFTEERELPKWTLRDSVKTILGYECRMAEADFRGRKWVAWYSVEVPLSVGPWKLWGLPGLIFEAYDSRMEYSYSMVSISADSSGNVTVFDWSDGKKKYTKVTRQKYLRAYSGQDFVNASKAKEAGLGNMASERKYDLREKDY